MTLLTIVQAATMAINLPRPVSVMGSTDPQVMTLLQLAQNSGRDLAREWPWQKLTVRRTFNALAQIEQSGEPPADYDRFAVAQRIWDQTRRTWLVGPLNPDEWDQVLTAPVATYPSKWCMLGGVIQIYPIPVPSDQFTYTYITENWVRAGDSSGAGFERITEDGVSRLTEDAPTGASTFSVQALTTGTSRPAWANDSDVALIPERLLEYALIWRWKQAKGLDYAEDMTTYEREREKAQARDRGPRTINTTAPPPFPDNFFPSLINY